MCIWSAFTGNISAAPEIWKTGCAIEGLWSGYYTGIATVDKNGIHSDKCCGYSKHWLEKFDLKNYTGCTGFFHSRTFSGGDEAWAHPFVGTNRKAVIIAQGSDGVFSDMSVWAAKGNALAAKGKKFPASSFEVSTARYPVLANGARVHVSEIMGQAIEAAYEECGDPLETVRLVGGELLEEAITLAIFHDIPDRIYFINMNQSGVVRFTPQGAYAASSRLAFDKTSAKYIEIPLNSVGYFSATQFYSELLPDTGFPVYDDIPEKCFTAAIAFLKDNPGSTLSQILDNGCGHLFPPDGIKLRALAAHRIAEFMISEHLAEYRNMEADGPCGTRGLRTQFFPLLSN